MDASLAPARPSNEVARGELQGSARVVPISRCRDSEREAEPFGIVGRSPVWRNVLDQIAMIAPTDATVLIQGETGTGKEIIARAVHNLSGRRNCSFVKVNCAAIPSGLLESELFGHEKGAFTGATAQRAGRFEMAHNGTLFLDEIGDLPLELQPKLLRVLQDREFERLGGSHTLRTDVRIVAATLRDLRQMVEEKMFRMDLYYRLNILPIALPPLRDRRDDIPLLVSHFAGEYARNMGRQPHTISPETMAVLRQYSWPGNVRELQNFIARAVILSPEKLLRPPLDELRPLTAGGTPPTNLKDVERAHILRVLRDVNWVVGGANGAAALLGLPRTTLIHRMLKLGIRRPRAETHGTS